MAKSDYAHILKLSLLIFLLLALWVQITVAPKVLSGKLVRPGTSEAIVKNSTGSLFTLFSNATGAFVAISDDRGTSWRGSTFTQLNCQFGRSGGEGVLLINSTGGLFVACANYSSDELNATSSGDWGDTWSSVVGIESNTRDYYVIDGVVDSNDNLILCSGDGAGINIYNSSDSGVNWTITENVFSTPVKEGCAIEVDSSDQFHLVGSKTSTNSNVSYANSTDPTSWPHVSILKNASVGLSLKDIDIAIDPIDEEIFVAFQKFSATSRISFFNSSNNGTSWTETEVIFGSATIYRFSLIADDLSFPHIILKQSSSPALLYSNSSDGGLTWITAVTLHESGDQAQTPHIRGTRTPPSNNVDDVLDYVIYNGSLSEVFFYNLTAPTIKDKTSPIVDFIDPTAPDNAYRSADFILVNVSVTEANERNISFFLFNSTNLTYINFSTFALPDNYSINFSGLYDDVFKYNVTVFDIANNSGFSSTRNITLDTQRPNVTNFLNSSITHSSALIYFNCSELCNSTLAYWEADDMAGTILFAHQTDFLTAHSFSLGALEDFTTYSWNVSVTDLANNINSTWPLFNFTTLATPVLSGDLEYLDREDNVVIAFNFDNGTITSIGRILSTGFSSSNRNASLNSVNISGDLQYGGALIGASPLKMMDHFCMVTKPSGYGAECGPDDDFNWVCQPSDCWNDYDGPFKFRPRKQEILQENLYICDHRGLKLECLRISETKKTCFTKEGMRRCLISPYWRKA